MNDQDRQNIEAALRAFPFWPFNRRPFVTFGVWFISRCGVGGGL